MKTKTIWILVAILTVAVVACGGLSSDETASGGDTIVFDVDFAILQAEGEYIIGGVVFNDINGDDVMGTCEPGIEGVMVQLLTSEDIVLDSTATDNTGYYAFAVTTTGDYRVEEIDPAGYISIINSVHLLDVQQNVTVNFADQTTDPSYSICGTVFGDADGDGVMDGDESGMPGVTVTLSGDGYVVTNVLGIYAFAVTTTGPYTVSAVEPEGYQSTTENPVDILVSDSDVVVDFGLRQYMDVPVDVKPGSDINPVNLKSNGVLPVAIMGGEDLDVTIIDPETIRLNGVAPLRWSIEDVCCDDPDETEMPDGYDDLTMKFETQEIAATLGEPARGDVLPLYMSGETFESVAFTGEEWILIVSVPKE
jgi:hypothetical protein